MQTFDKNCPVFALQDSYVLYYVVVVYTLFSFHCSILTAANIRELLTSLAVITSIVSETHASESF